MGTAEGDITTNSTKDKYVLENIITTMGSLVDSYNPKCSIFSYWDEVNRTTVTGDYFETTYIDVIPNKKYYVKDIRWNETPADHKPVAIYLYGKRTGTGATFLRAFDLSTLTAETNDYYSFTMPSDAYVVRVVFHRGNSPISADIEGRGWGYFGYYMNDAPNTYTNPYWAFSVGNVVDYIMEYLNINNVNEFNETTAYNKGDLARIGVEIIEAKENISANTPFDKTKWTYWCKKLLINQANQHEAQLNGFTIHDVMTQAQYNALGTYDVHTIYPIVG